MKELYHHLLMDHYHNPRNKKKIETPDFSSKMLNPSCGDSIAFEGTISDDNIIDVGFSGTGCVISQATASLLSEYVKGKPVDEILKLDAEDIQRLIGTKLGILRIKCALLPLQALKKGLIQYRSQHSQK